MGNPSSILVYSGLDLVGDGLMKLPFLRALRHAFPEARITWVAGTGSTVYAGSLAPLVRPLLDEVIENAGIGLAWGELLHRPLPGRRFDLIIDTQRRMRVALILRRIAHGRFVSGVAGFRLSDAKPQGAYVRKRRMVDTLLDLVAAASGQPAIPGGPLALDPAFEQAAAQALPAGPRYAGFAPGAGGVHKRWPLDRYIDLARRLEAEGCRPVFLLGPAESEWRTKIPQALPNAILPRATDPQLSASPLFTIALARHLAIAVANDSGTGHMLAAGGAPLVSLFGPTDPTKFAPYAARGAIVTASGFGGQDMEAIPVEAVLGAVHGLLR